jgi:hypothetical protein
VSELRYDRLSGGRWSRCTAKVLSGKLFCWYPARANADTGRIPSRTRREAVKCCR